MAKSASSQKQVANSEFEGKTIDQLSEHLRGACLRPGDNGYDDVRTIWNAMIDKRPATITQCVNGEDGGAFTPQNIRRM